MKQITSRTLWVVVCCMLVGVLAAQTAYAETPPEVQFNRLVKLTDRGLQPKTLNMKLDESILFFLNDTTESLATIEIDFGKKPTHCASSNLKIDKDGVIRSSRPYGPKDFASICFHDRGSYPFTIYGLKTSPQGVQGTIIVE